MALTYDSRAAAGTLIQSYVRIKEARQNDTPGLPTLVATFKGVCQGVRGHEKVPTDGQVEVPIGGRVEVPTLRVVS